MFPSMVYIEKKILGPENIEYQVKAQTTRDVMLQAKGEKPFWMSVRSFEAIIKRSEEQ